MARHTGSYVELQSKHTNFKMEPIQTDKTSMLEIFNMPLQRSEMILTPSLGDWQKAEKSNTHHLK